MSDVDTCDECARANVGPCPHINPTAIYMFKIEGVEQQRTFLPTQLRPFDETYQVEGEHPAEALEKLVRNEVEWLILDSNHQFTITYLPCIECGGTGEAAASGQRCPSCAPTAAAAGGNV